MAVTTWYCVVQFKTLKDSILAYAYSYPVNTNGSELSLVVSRRPERYSSAAPLTPDARQRIVSELVDFKHGVVLSMTVYPLQLHSMLNYGCANEKHDDTQHQHACHCARYTLAFNTIQIWLACVWTIRT